jgi:hypothetical protein
MPKLRVLNMSMSLDGYAAGQLFDDLGDAPERYECVEHVCSPAITHVRLARKV